MSEGKLELVSDITDYTQVTSFDPATAAFDPNTFGVEPPVESEPAMPDSTSEPDVDQKATNSDVEVKSDVVDVGNVPDGNAKDAGKSDVQPAPPSEPIEEKKYDPFSELGFTEEKDRSFVSKILDAYKDGTLHEFMEKGTKDYNKISDAEILKMEILKQYPKADEEVLDKLYLRKLKEFGFTQGEDEAEDALAEKMIKMHTDKLREEAQREQENYRATAYERKPSEAEIKAQKDWEDFNKFIDEDQTLSEFGRSKTYAFDDFNMEIPADLDVKDYAKNPAKFLSKFFKEDGKMDTKAWQEFLLCGFAGRKGIADAMAFGESKATKKHHDSLRGVDVEKTPYQPAPVAKGKLEKVH